jgi:hypothetical protein
VKTFRLTKAKCPMKDKCVGQAVMLGTSDVGSPQWRDK